MCIRDRPIGAHCTTWLEQEGVNFAVYSRHAERIEVCLYEARGELEIARFDLPACINGVWHGFVAGLGAGQLYGLRAHGRYQPTRGHRFNPAKLLVDPYARELVGEFVNLSLERDYQGPANEQSLLMDAPADPVDNAARIPKARVVDRQAELLQGAAITPGPQIPMAHTVLYDCLLYTSPSPRD